MLQDMYYIMPFTRRGIRLENKIKIAYSIIFEKRNFILHQYENKKIIFNRKIKKFITFIFNEYRKKKFNKFMENI